MPNSNNKGKDQPVHPRSLISTFVICFPDSIIPLLAKSKISELWLVSVTEQASLSPTCLQTPKKGFLVTWLINKALIAFETLKGQTTIQLEQVPRGTRIPLAGAIS